MTPRQFQNYYEGYYEQRQSDVRESWEQIRFVCFYSAAGNLKKGTKPEQILKFPWDGEDLHFEHLEPEDKSLEEIGEEIKRHWDEIDKKRGKSDCKH